MKVFHQDHARKRIAVGVLATSMLATVLGLAPAAHAVIPNLDGGCSGSDLLSKVHDVVAAGGTWTISLHKDCKYDYTVADGPTDAALVIDGNNLTTNGPVNLTIFGNGATITINKKGADLRHFDVVNGASLTLNNLTTTGGDIETSPTLVGSEAAGSIFVGRNSTLIGQMLTVTGNKVFAANLFNVNAWAGGIYNNGTMTLTKSTVSNNTVSLLGGNASAFAGGIDNDGTATLDRSVVKGNRVTGNAITGYNDGGGVENDGTLTLLSSTLSGNSASVTAVNATGVGGGLANYGTTSVTTSVFSGNKATTDGLTQLSAGGGILNKDTLLMDVTGTLNTPTGKTSQVVNNTASCKGPFCVALGGGYSDADGFTFGTRDGEFGTTLFQGNLASANKGVGAGGGLFVTGTANLTDATVTKNTAKGAVAALGGGIAANPGATVNIDTSTITKNKPDNCYNVLGCS